MQFVKKADAECAIEKMQGFPIGGSRIRLSWGRSQCEFFQSLSYYPILTSLSDKAAQAAAQAAQAAAMQAHVQGQMANTRNVQSVTTDQAIHLLQRYGFAIGNPAAAQSVTNNVNGAGGNIGGGTDMSTAQFAGISEDTLRNLLLPRENESNGGGGSGFDIFGSAFGSSSGAGTPGEGISRGMRSHTAFAPFSPEANIFMDDTKLRELPHPSKHFAPGFGPVQDTQSINSGPHVNGASGSSGSGKTSPGSAVRPPSAAQRFASYLEHAPGVKTISRPPSSSARTGDYFEGHEQDMIQDLNGTLASLDLDHISSSASAWRVQERGGLSA